ncbi:MAG: amidohydrolase family protein [Chloroflexi bacterium]|nr:amidohydrolase family protein [Chloroflexota bacterium]MCY4246884.1 amidohydrolase family protein [Chloroflexota bacterium]
MGFTIIGATLIDGNGGAPLENAAVHIEGERIAWVGAAAVMPAAAQAAEQLDASGKWLLPGLIDAHIHICYNGEESTFALLEKPRDALVLEAVQICKRTLQQGVTTIRDVGGETYIEMSLRDAISRGWIQGPRMKLSGRVISMTGGHAHFIAREADGPDEMRKAAREQIKAGADLVKLMATGGSATPGQDIHASQLTVAEIAAVCEVAHMMGRTVAAHCHGTGGIRNCMLGGVDSIEHGTYLDDETADMMVERGAALCLTVGVGNPDLESYPLSPVQQADAERRMPMIEQGVRQIRKTIALARSKGIFLGCGTDAGGNPLAPHRFALAREVELIVENDVPPLEAISIVTRNNAKILRWDDEIGTVEAGKYADLLLLNSDPVADIRSLRDIAAVYKGGEMVS